jgi:hypothetical protein
MGKAIMKVHTLENNRHLELRCVLLSVSQSPLVSHALVFGSLARGAPNPRDLDLLVTLPDLRSPNSYSSPYFHALYDLLAIAARWNGFFDPFIWNTRRLWTRNATSTHYITAKLRPYIECIQANAIPLAEVLAREGLKDEQR